jgi:hypothetical protein
MLQLGMLPQETRCVACGTATTNTQYFWAICERAFVKKDASRVWWVIALSWICFGWLGLILLLLRARDDRVHGSDVRLRLPLRICPECAPGLKDPERLEDVVLAVPLYDELLDQYPDAELAPDTEPKGVDLSAPPRD